MNWRVLYWPITLPPVIVLVVYALGSFLMLLMLGRNFGLTALSLLFIPWCYLLLGLMTLCGQQKLVDVARGRFADRVAAGASDLNPFQSGLAVKLVLLIASVLALLLLLPDQKLVLFAAALIYPAVYLALALEESLREGLHPGVLKRLVVGAGPLYPVLVVVLSGSTGLLAHALIYDQSLTMLIASAYLYLLAQPLAGWLLYQRRSALMLHTEFSPEQAQAEAVLKEARALEDQLDQLHRLCATGAVKQANVRLEAYLGERRSELDPRVHERLRDLRYTQLFLEHGVHYLQRLADRGELKKAWSVFKDCQAVEDRFRPLSAQMLLDLTRAAGREDARLVADLLEDFPQAYPDSDLQALAQFRLARINIELLGNGSGGLALLQQLEKSWPEFAAEQVFRDYRARLRIRRT
jgi:hypothetical protein